MVDRRAPHVRSLPGHNPESGGTRTWGTTRRGATTVVLKDTSENDVSWQQVYRSKMGRKWFAETILFLALTAARGDDGRGECSSQR